MNNIHWPWMLLNVLQLLLLLQQSVEWQTCGRTFWNWNSNSNRNKWINFSRFCKSLSSLPLILVYSTRILQESRPFESEFQWLIELSANKPQLSSIEIVRPVCCNLRFVASSSCHRDRCARRQLATVECNSSVALNPIMPIAELDELSNSNQPQNPSKIAPEAFETSFECKKPLPRAYRITGARTRDADASQETLCLRCLEWCIARNEAGSL